MILKDMEWTDKHDITLCREVLVMEYLKQKQELESDHRKDKRQLRREELEASVE